MAGMSIAYLNTIAQAGATAINYIGLVNQAGTELEGGSPAYARKAVHWTTPDEGTIRPYANAGLTEDLLFNIPGGVTVGGWRGYSHSASGASGDTDFGGKDLANESFTNQGEYRLIGAESGILHQIPE